MSTTQSHHGSHHEYRPLVGLGIATQISLGLSTGMQLIGDLIQSTGQAMVEGAKLENLGHLLSIIGNLSSILGIILAMLAIGLGIVWMRRAARNLPALGAAGARAKDWLAFLMLIPVVNMFIPLLLMQETYKASDPEILDATGWKQSKPSVEIYTLTFCWVGAAVLNLVLVLMGMQVLPAVAVEVLAGGEMVFRITTVVCMLLVIRAISIRQSLKHQRVSAGATNNDLLAEETDSPAGDTTISAQRNVRLPEEPRN